MKKILFLVFILSAVFYFNNNKDEELVLKGKVSSLEKLEMAKPTNQIKKVVKQEPTSQTSEVKSLAEAEKGFEREFKNLERLTDQLNSYSLSGNAPKELQEQYKSSRLKMLRLHKKYVDSINTQIKKLTKEGKNI